MEASVVELITQLGLPTVGCIFLAHLYVKKGDEVSNVVKELQQVLKDNIESRTELSDAIRSLITHVEKESIQRQEFMVRLATKLLDEIGN